MRAKKGRLQRIGYGRYRANYTLDDPVEQGGSKERVRYLAMVPVAAIFAADRPHGGSIVDLRAALTNSGVVVELCDVFAYAHEMVKWGLLLRAQRGKYMATADKNIDPELPPKTPEDQTVRFRAAQFFREDYPDGGGIDELHAALTTAGADVQRASVATYAAGMIALGYLERIEYGRYRAVPLVEVEEEENEPTSLLSGNFPEGVS